MWNAAGKTGWKTVKDIEKICRKWDIFTVENAKTIDESRRGKMPNWIFAIHGRRKMRRSKQYEKRVKMWSNIFIHSELLKITYFSVVWNLSEVETKQKTTDGQNKLFHRKVEIILSERHLPYLWSMSAELILFHRLSSLPWTFITSEPHSCAPINYLIKLTLFYRVNFFLPENCFPLVAHADAKTNTFFSWRLKMRKIWKANKRRAKWMSEAT